jgi:hypothetical protein
VGSQYLNRAELLLPEGSFVQDKLALTLWERESDGWFLVGPTAAKAK